MIDNSRFITYIDLLSTYTLLFWVALSGLNSIILKICLLQEAALFEQEKFVSSLEQ
jgi:hypothetical protein